jgi:hypothetical protein
MEEVIIYSLCVFLMTDTDHLWGYSSEWKGYQKALLRFFFLYFVIQAVLLDGKYYAQLFSMPGE